MLETLPENVHETMANQTLPFIQHRMTAMNHWEFWIDVGGTFTDCLGRNPSGKVRAHKILSSGVYKGMTGEGSTRDTLIDVQRTSDPDHFFDHYTLRIGDDCVEIQSFDASIGQFSLKHPLEQLPTPGTIYEIFSNEEAPITGIRWLMQKCLHESIGKVSVRLGTTRGTNALLERQGARTALVTTKGFRDVLRIAYQNRPRLFQLHIRKPEDLYETVVEIDERMDKDGNIICPVDETVVREQLITLKKQGITSLAVCFLNSYRNGTHELTVKKVAEELDFDHVSCQVNQLQRMVSRGDTTVVDAYLTPIIRAYIAGIRTKIPQASIKLMTSAGGLVDAELFVGKDSILSGPAGGVVGQAYVAQAACFKKSIGFDMGGTSTDVSRFDGRYERRYEMEVNDPESDTGVRVVAPMLAIETVAAGGGSICWFDGQKPVVGPRSAGASPGPACYGRGGPLTVTDINLYLGKIIPDHFAFPLDREVVEQRLQDLLESIHEATGQRYSPDELASGFTAIANANMAAPIKKISIARGYDVRDYVLVSFGGAGAQHACAIARELGIKKVLQHPYAGILSAFGIGMSDVKKFAARDVSKAYNTSHLNDLESLFQEIESDLREQVREERIPEHRIQKPERILEMRYRGQEARIPVPCPDDGNYLREFEILHRQLYGFIHQRPVEIYALRVELTGETEKTPWPTTPASQQGVPEPSTITQAYFDKIWHDTAVFFRNNLKPGHHITGPAIIVEDISTVVIEPGWDCEVTERDDLLLTDLVGAPNKIDIGTEVDAITLELFNNRFATMAEQMGATLEKTSLSTNVKERLDFSCAIFDPQGDLVVNAPHIPVHLGAMSECVKQLIEDVPDMQPGDVFVTNDPFRGGSHLPDVTVVSPVFLTELADINNGASSETKRPQDDPPSNQIIFFTASRAHHSEIGGITPGSMPPFSKTLEEEGVLIRHFHLIHHEQSSEDRLSSLLSSGRYPSRSVRENIADINAQVAANQTGITQLLQMTERYTLPVVHAYMNHIQKAAEQKMRSALLTLLPGQHRFTDYLDDGAPVQVTITIRHFETEKGEPSAEAVVDFSGTSPVLPGNLNANRAITSSAVLYCFRCLINEDIPLNAGVLTPIKLLVPENCMLNPPAHENPAHCAAVVGGNVETSQRIVDTIFGALGVVAASQGTMNNFLFGRGGEQPFGYYETICGGAGAGPNFNGAHAVHTNMTNTRLTDPEVLEDRYPIRLRKFQIRVGSGGNGQHPGGDGIIRQIEFLEPLTISLLTQRRTRPPYGINGGQPGKPGRNLLRRQSQPDEEDLGWCGQFEVAQGDVITLMTPGGGGFGNAT